MKTMKLGWFNGGEGSICLRRSSKKIQCPMFTYFWASVGYKYLFSSVFVFLGAVPIMPN